MVEKVIIDLLANLESHVNDIPYVINPCKACRYIDEGRETHVKNFATCKDCCWYYDSKFEVKK